MSAPYYHVVQRNVFERPEWAAYARGQGSLPNLRHSADVMAEMFYYIGNTERAETLSYHASIYFENLVQRQGGDISGLRYLFQAAIFCSLANRSHEAELLWGRIIAARRKIDPVLLDTERRADYWIYEAYALAKLQLYAEVVEPAELGFNGIRQGKGLDPIPYRNTLEYGLAAILKALAFYHLVPSSKKQLTSQKALIHYKEQNVKHGRLGFRVIFDLQRSYPDVFMPVLPGSDPEQD